MLNDFLAANIRSQAAAANGGFVTAGYGQVEPNHLSAQRTGQIYAQLPAASTIDVLENGQFVKYDYANGVVNLTGPGEWMLVYNEIKLYHDGQSDCEFAMKKNDYMARLYSPSDGQGNLTGHSRYYGGTDASGATIEKATASADPYVPGSTENPFAVETGYAAKDMPIGTTMVPRVFKTNVGDIFTTNMVKATTLTVNQILVPGTADGILAVKASPAATDMQWQVVKVYTLADGQKAVKLMRIA